MDDLNINNLRTAIGQPLIDEIHASNLPKFQTMTLLTIWEAGSRSKLRALAESGKLLTVLKRQHRQGLQMAWEAANNNMNLTPTECLQVAELPLKL